MERAGLLWTKLSRPAAAGACPLPLAILSLARLPCRPRGLRPAGQLWLSLVGRPPRAPLLPPLLPLVVQQLVEEGDQQGQGDGQSRGCSPHPPGASKEGEGARHKQGRSETPLLPGAGKHRSRVGKQGEIQG